MKKEFYKKRREALRRKLRKKDKQIDLKEHVRNFQEYLKACIQASGVDRQEIIQGRKEILANILSRTNVGSLTKDDIIEILHYSWATDAWSDYPQKAMDVLDRNGLPRIRRELKKLLYGKDNLDKRFDNFNLNIKGIGAQYISEILAFTFPQKCVLWNRAAADVSIFLGINILLPRETWMHRMKLDGKNYVKCCQVLGTVRDEMIESGLERSDFVDVYHFMLFLRDGLKKQPGVLEEVRYFSKQNSGWV